MLNFLNILLWHLRNRGPMAAWRRLRRGISGYASPFCAGCGGWKGHTFSDVHEACIMTRVLNAIENLPNH